MQEGVVEAPEYSEQLAAPEERGRVRPAGVAQETQQVLESGDFYLANPEAISQDTRVMLQQRENLVRLATVYSRAGMGFEHLQTASQIQDLDNNMLYLQGMQGIQELKTFRDPRRLAGVVSEFAGQSINYQPRQDGLYNVVTTGPDGQMRILQEGVSPAEIEYEAMLLISPQARERAAELAAQRAEYQLELENFTAQETVKTLNDIHKAVIQGQLDTARTIAGRIDSRLVETADGIFLQRRDQRGNEYVYGYNPAEEGRKRWFLKSIDPVEASFGEVGVTSLTGGVTPQMMSQDQLQQALQAYSGIRQPLQGTGE